MVYFNIVLASLSAHKFDGIACVEIIAGLNGMRLLRGREDFLSNEKEEKKKKELPYSARTRLLSFSCIEPEYYLVVFSYYLSEIFTPAKLSRG